VRGIARVSAHVCARGRLGASSVVAHPAGCGTPQNPLNNLLIGEFFVGWMPLSALANVLGKRCTLLINKHTIQLIRNVHRFPSTLAKADKGIQPTKNSPINKLLSGFWGLDALVH